MEMSAEHELTSIMSPTFDLVTTTHRGGAEGTSFDDSPPSRDISTSVITKIVVRHVTYIVKLEIYMNDGRIYTHGGNDGVVSSFVLETGEFVKRIEGRSDSGCIVGLTFVTNRQTCGPYGGTTGESFEWGTAPHEARCMRLLSFSGSSGTYISGLRAVFAKYHADTEKTVRYESLAVRETPTQTSSSVAGEVAKSFSNFTFHLMSPIITLYVGSEGVEFHAYEDTLCQLPFFQAALRGHFKEASDQVIRMPEDDPSRVSALIEFMYTGNYTYTYDPKIVSLQDGSNAPVGDLTEGLFHLGIHVIASKYDYPALVAIAMKNFEAVVTELASIDALRLWQAAYSEGLQLPNRKLDFERYCSGKGLVSWVKCLFGEHREEMDKTMMEYPALSCDLLRLTTGDDC